MYDIQLGARGRTAGRWRRGRWRPVCGDTVLPWSVGWVRSGGGGTPVLFATARRRRLAAYTLVGLRAGWRCYYQVGGGIVTRRCRRPSSFPFSYPTRVRTRTIVYHSTHGHTVCVAAASLFHPSLISLVPIGLFGGLLSLFPVASVGIFHYR